jgi:hypothetical protein
MNHRFLPLILVLFACSPDSSENEASESQQTDETSQTISAETNAFINSILGDSQATIRGINLGDPLSKVESTETMEILETSETERSYTYEPNDKELIDVYYTAEREGFINDVTVDLFLSSEAKSEEVLKGLNHYFTLKYGKAEGQADAPKWVIDEGDSLKIIKYDYKLDKGLRLQFFRSAY